MEGLNVWVMMLKSLGMLSIVLGILVGVLYLMKKFTHAGGRHGERNMIRMISAFYLTPKERVVLMDVMGRKILIGVTPQGINKISEFYDEDVEPVQEPVEENNGFRQIITGMARNLTRSKTVPDDTAILARTESGQ
jgi:flagellar protein FliO/FliZ